MNHLVGIVYNYPLLAAALSWLTAQVLKCILVLIMERKFNPERLFGSGGMPSAHSATVCALAIAVGRSEGVGSALFAICIVLALIVMYDAMGVRRSTGEQAKLLNKIIIKLNLSEPDQKELHRKLIQFQKQPDRFDDAEGEDDEVRQIKEKLGHTPLEVLAGAMLGIVMALIMPI